MDQRGAYTIGYRGRIRGRPEGEIGGHLRSRKGETEHVASVRASGNPSVSNTIIECSLSPTLNATERVLNCFS